MNYFGGVHKTFYAYWQNLPFLLYALTYALLQMYLAAFTG